MARGRNLIPTPGSLGFDEAAAIALQGLTTYHCIKTSGALKEGESVLVPAALMRRRHAIVGFYLPQIMRRRDLFASSLQGVLGWIPPVSSSSPSAPPTRWRTPPAPTPTSKAAGRPASSS